MMSRDEQLAALNAVSQTPDEPRSPKADPTAAANLDKVRAHTSMAS